MSNPIKYSTGSETQALKRGNLYFGSGDVGKGPTSSTGYYNGYSPPSGGYMIYLYKSGAPGDLSYFSAANDTQLISFTNNLANTSFTSATQCLNYFVTQTDKMVFNIDYPPIITSGLVLNVDAAFVSSYTTSGSSWYDLSPSNNTGTLNNSPTYSAGTIVFDGTDDYVTFSTRPTITNQVTLECWYYMKGYQSQNQNRLISNADNYVLFFDSSATNLSFYMNGKGQISTSATFINNWRHVVATYDGTIRALYVDGILKTSGNTSGNVTVSGVLNIGAYENQSAYTLNGQMGQARIYNRGLTADEVLQNYAATGSRYLPLQVQYLVVAGGGGGQNNRSGGGGAGGLLSGVTTSLSLNTNYTVTVGAGGSYDTNGSNSVFHNNTSIGGGRSGTLSGDGFSGGSGGGSGHFWSGFGTLPKIGGAGVSGQGFSGGTAFSGSPELGPGGGGASQSGGNSNSTPFGFGGAGLYSSEYTSLGGSPAGWFAGGGGGGNSYGTTKALGGNGGGGNGSIYINIPSTNGVINTGGGGGGNGVWGGGSASGGSGIVIIRVPVYYSATFSSGVTYSLTKSGGYSYYVVTATSTTSETVSFS